MNPNAQPNPAQDTQINWLELARFAADGEGHGDLGRGVLRLATLAAAVHRSQPTNQPLTVRTEKDTQWVHGRTPQAAPGAQPLTGSGPRIAITEDAR